ncbi:MAG: BlaI/MecI/CopY family transcriptional regulator [Oscillospiraceae bacterium]
MNDLAEKITDSELEVMRALWDAADALPIAEIRRTLQKRQGWEATTIKTLVSRLCSKGAVAQERRNVFYYRALISETEYNEWATADLIRKLYRGSAKNLVAALLHSDELTTEDVDELRAMFHGEDKK